MRRLSLILATLAIAAAAPAITPAIAGSATSDVAILEGCRERAVLVPGVEALVRARVPAQFELVRDPLGRPLLAVVGARCERYWIRGVTRPKSTTFTFFVAIIESPDGEGCLSPWPVVGDLDGDLLPLCSFYNFFAAYDNRALVRAYRRTIPNFPVYRVRKLRFEAGAFDPARLGSPFRFRAAGRTPSPFELKATVREGAVGGPMTYSFWFPDSPGLLVARIEVDDFAPGEMDATLRASPDSEMAALLGSETPTPIAGLANRYSHAEGRLIDASG